MDYLAGYEAWLSYEKKAAANTLCSYTRDVRQFSQWMEGERLELSQATQADIKRYALYLGKHGKSDATIVRSVAALKSFYGYLQSIHVVPVNPAKGFTPTKIERKLPAILNSKEVDLFLDQPDPSDAKGCRDKAMLELLYATGIRATELVDLDVNDINLHAGLLYCRGEKGERIIPIYPQAVTAVSDYIFRVRRMILAPDGGQALFTNLNGHRLTRQGFWKIVKGYAQQAGIVKEITPHTLRHSFALHLLENGAELKDIQHMLGHADISSTQMYVHMMNNHYQEVYRNCHPRAKSS